MQELADAKKKKTPASKKKKAPAKKPPTPRTYAKKYPIDVDLDEDDNSVLLGKRSRVDMFDSRYVEDLTNEVELLKTQLQESDKARVEAEKMASKYEGQISGMQGQLDEKDKMIDLLKSLIGKK